MRIAIAGAGKVGKAIARELLTNGHDILLIDRDPAEVRPESIPGARMLLADACEAAALEAADLGSCQIMIAATGDDKVNLVVSLLAKTEYGVPRVVARVNHPKNEWMFDESWGVDVAVSTPRIVAALVEEAVSVGELVKLFSFRKGNADLVEITLAADSPVIGKRIDAITMPMDAALVAILRGSRVITPSADDSLEVGDELLFVSATDQQPQLQQIFRRG
jgi:trk system potassium uptake protein TrkA